MLFSTLLRKNVKRGTCMEYASSRYIQKASTLQTPCIYTLKVRLYIHRDNPTVQVPRTPGWAQALQFQHKPIASSNRITDALLRSIVQYVVL